MSNQDERIVELQRQHHEDPENGSVAMALEAMLRRAGRGDEADRVAVPTAIKSGRNAREYVLGSNGKKPKLSRFTVVNTARGERITFATQRESLTVADWEAMDQKQRQDAVMAAERDGRFWRIGAMVGSDNSNYENFGIIRLENGFPKFFWSSESQIAKSDKTVKVFAALWNSLSQGILPDGLEFHNEGRCCRCRKVLTVPESRERGIGPVCFGRYHSAQRPVQPRQANAGE